MERTYQKTPRVLPLCLKRLSAYNDVMDLIDTHCHLDFAVFDADREQVMQHAREQGINRIVVPGVRANTWAALSSLCENNAGLYPAFGLHPVFLGQHQEGDVAALEAQLASSRPVAVGEIGLDFQMPEADKSGQLALFNAQLALAEAARLPVILHVRKAHDQVLAILKRLSIRGGIAHAFNGSIQQARQYMELGFKLGFGGMLTFERSTRLRTLAKELPLDAIVLETDAPDLTVSQHRGERNSPAYLIYCLEALAEVREEDIEDVAKQTTMNALNVLNW